MKTTVSFMAVIALCIFLSGCSCIHKKDDVVYQISTFNALLESIFDGDTRYRDLKRHGDFGIGTFEGLDGEMIALNGEFYQIKADGIAYKVDDSIRAPFAVITFFEPDKTITIDESLDFRQLGGYIDENIPTKNIFYAIKIDGVFSYMKVRSVPGQKKPYPPISEIIRKQPVFEFNNVTGTIVGFRFPEYMKGLNVPGYHFHFITDERKAGGHVLECVLKSGKAEIDFTDEFIMLLPDNEQFYNADFTR